MSQTFVVDDGEDDERALADRRATGCHYECGVCLCPRAPYEYDGCLAPDALGARSRLRTDEQRQAMAEWAKPRLVTFRPGSPPEVQDLEHGFFDVYVYEPAAEPARFTAPESGWYEITSDGSPPRPRRANRSGRPVRLTRSVSDSYALSR